MTPQQTTAVFNGKYYAHFGVCPKTASVYGDKPEDIVGVELIVAEDQAPPSRDDKGVDYWGWFDSAERKFTLVYNRRFVLDMCFPYGMEAEEKRGNGKAYRLIVQEKK